MLLFFFGLLTSRVSWFLLLLGLSCVASLPTPQACEDMENTNQDDPVHGCCGIPFVDTVDEDRLALAQDRLGKPWDARHIMAEFV